MAEFDSWIGKTRSSTAVLDIWPANALHATLDLDEADAPTGALPLLWHWLYFLETAPRGRIGSDGHPQKGDFLPPIVHPRRMFAGARTKVRGPLLFAKPAELTETIAVIQTKSGSSGTMFLVQVNFDYRQDGELCIQEQRDYLYLPTLLVSAPATEPVAEPELVKELPPSDWAKDLSTDEVLLFRFSALTFNSHRIHYDLPYASLEERYPRLVIHAPLTAILLAALGSQQRTRNIDSFRFRAVSPVFCGDSLRLRGSSVHKNELALTAYAPSGKAAMAATMKFR